jgi:hypothetical protein
MAYLHPTATRPDATKYNPDPAYLRRLVGLIGGHQKSIAEAFGITDRALRYYLSPIDSPTYRPAPYLVQYALEQAVICSGVPLTLLHG